MTARALHFSAIFAVLLTSSLALAEQTTLAVTEQARIAPADPVSAETTLEEDCARAHVLNLAITFPAGQVTSSRAPSDPNLCVVTSVHPRHELSRTILAAIAEQNALVEERTGLKLRELIPVGFSIQLHLSPEGPLTSAAAFLPGIRAGFMKIGLYSSGKADGFHRAIYTHELGHLVQGALKAALPDSGVGALAGNSALSEGFADLFAYTVNGTFIGEDAHLTGCMADLREYRQMISYRGPSYRFSSYFSSMKFTHCCTKLAAAKTVLTPEQEGLCAHFGSPQMQNVADQVKTQLKPKLKEFVRDSGLFDQRGLDEAKSIFDGHQLGVPWSTWVVNLAKIEGLTPFAFLEKAFAEVKSSDLLTQVRCGIMVNDEPIGPYEIWSKVPIVSLQKANDVILRRHSNQQRFYTKSWFPLGESAANLIQINWKSAFGLTVGSFAEHEDERVNACVSGADRVTATFADERCSVVCDISSVR